MIARQEFYGAVRYDGADSSTLNLELDSGFVANPTGANDPPPQLGNLDRLVEWHFAAPPDSFERRRNQVIYDSYQHNRDPFIDHPEYVWSVFVRSSERQSDCDRRGFGRCQRRFDARRELGASLRWRCRAGGAGVDARQVRHRRHLFRSHHRRSRRPVRSLVATTPSARIRSTRNQSPSASTPTHPPRDRRAAPSRSTTSTLPRAAEQATGRTTPTTRSTSISRCSTMPRRRSTVAAKLQR